MLPPSCFMRQRSHLTSNNEANWSCCFELFHPTISCVLSGSTDQVTQSYIKCHRKNAAGFFTQHIQSLRNAEVQVSLAFFGIACSKLKQAMSRTCFSAFSSQFLVLSSDKFEIGRHFMEMQSPSFKQIELSLYFDKEIDWCHLCGKNVFVEVSLYYLIWALSTFFVNSWSFL